MSLRPYIQNTLFVGDRGATFDESRRYRYHLWRRWGRRDPSARVLLFVMLNPSTADAERDDPTVASCTRIAQALGYDGLEVVNLFALCATDPRELVRRCAAEDPIGPDNDVAISLRANSCAAVVVAWGIVPTGLRKLHRPDPVRFRHRTALELLALAGARERTYCLGYTSARWPRHPLFLRASTALQRFG